MDSSFSLTNVAAAIGLFTLLRTIFFLFYKKFRFHQENKTNNSSSLPHNWKHHVFPSFHGTDVRKAFLSHILKEFERKGIDSFIDNGIERSKSISPELLEAIRGSRIAIVLLSKNYASSTWCLNELVEIIKCREELGQTVMVIFYEVDPSDVRKQTGDFGKVFRKTCKGKTKDNIRRWKHALAEVAEIAGYHSRNCDTEAKMIEKIVTDVSNKLNSSLPSSDFDKFIGMESHMTKMEPLLRLDLEEVRMIGILGPSGIGKTTIARFLFNRHSKDFQLSVFMENIKTSYVIPACSDDYNVKLYLQEQFMSQIINEMGFKIPHLGVAKDRLKDKKVLIVLDDVDRLVVVEAMAKETCWFGPRSRVIITTQDQKLLKGSGINQIYKVDFPSSDEALQMFCMYVFGQKSPKDGFTELVREVPKLADSLPLGLRVMGSYFRGMSKEEWTKALPRLRTHLNRDIESILKFSYDALCDEDKNLFLHIACFFNNESLDIVEGCLASSFSDVMQGLHVLAEKSIVSLDSGVIEMHNLLVQLGREIVRKQSVRPGKRQFLVDARDIREVLTNDKAGSNRVIGIDLTFSSDNEEDILCTSERAFERLSNLQFLRIDGEGTNLYFPRSLSSISRKLILLSWTEFPMPCFPSSFHPKFLVKLHMQKSNLAKLWEGIQPLSNLKWMDLSFSQNLKELPDLSTATNLCELNLGHCSNLVELPSSIVNAINLKYLELSHCSSLVELPSFLDNAHNLQKMNLSHCSSLVVLPSSIGNTINLQKLNLRHCSSLVELPSSIGNAINLQDLDLVHCSSLVELPSSLGNVVNLKKLNLRHCSSLVELPSSIGNAINLQNIDLGHCSSLVELPFSIGNIINLQNLDLNHCSSLVELPSSIGNAPNLQKLNLSHCSSLVELPFSIGYATNLQDLILCDCSSLVELPFSIGNAINLQKLDLSHCSNLVEIPNSIAHATNLQELILWECSSIVKLPSSIGHATNIKRLDLGYCSSLVELPCSTANLTGLESFNIYGCSSLVELPFYKVTNQKYLDLSHCSSLVKLSSSIVNAINLHKLNLSFCSSLVELPSSIGSAVNLQELNLSYCSSLVELPSSMRNLRRLSELDLTKCSKLEVLLTNINLESLKELNLSDCSWLESYHETSTNTEDLKQMPSSMRSYREIQELGPWTGRISCLHRLVVSRMQKLVSLPQLPYSLLELDAENCESLERLDCSFRNPDIRLNFVNCFKLYQEARDLIIQTPTNQYAVLPGGEVPECFTYRAYGSSLTMKLNQIPLRSSAKFRACILLADKDKHDSGYSGGILVYCSITSKQNALTACTSSRKILEPVFPGHLCIFEVEAVEVTSTELVFQFELRAWIHEKDWEIKQCGVLQLDGDLAMRKPL